MNESAPHPRLVPIDDPEARASALALLAAGELVALPTETVYGLACDATNAEAVARLFAAKGRPATNPLICHLAELEAARRVGVLDARAERLAAAFWPGPLTLVVPKREPSPLAPAVTAGRNTVALRVPDAAFLRALARDLGRPIAAPSANRSGRVSATTAAAVVAELGARVPLVVDGGPARIGIESTIVGLFDATPRLLRPGGLPAEAIEAVLGEPLAAGEDAPEVAADGGPNDATGTGPARAAQLSPGRLASHYAPRARLRLDVRDVRPGEALLAFGPRLPEGTENAVARINLSPAGDLAEAAAALFEALRTLDASGAEAIAVAPIPATGLGIAIRDRLTRAAAPRG